MEATLQIVNKETHGKLLETTKDYFNLTWLRTSEFRFR